MSGAKFQRFQDVDVPRRCQLSNLPPSCKVSGCFILLKGRQMKEWRKAGVLPRLTAPGSRGIWQWQID